MTTHSHGPAGPSCDCAGHRHAQLLEREASAGSSLWASLLPVALCAFCPACMSVWAPLLGMVGIGLALPEVLHGALLFIAVALSLAVVGRRAYQRKFWGAFVVAVAGTSCLVANHFAGELAVVTALGVACLLVAAAWERRRARAHFGESGVFA